MRILVTTHYWLPHPGGIERVAQRQAELLVERGHEVHVLTSAVGNPAGTGRREERGVALTAVPAWNGLERIGVPWPVFSTALVRHVRRLVAWCDVAVCHGQVYAATLAALAEARAARTPAVLVQHNPAIAYRRLGLRAAQAAADRSLGGWSLRRADAVVVPSSTTAAYVRSLAAVTPLVLPWGIDLERLRPHASDAERLTDRRRLGVPDGAFLVVGAGRLAVKNRFDVLVRGCAQAAPHLPALHGVVLGSGPEAGRLTELAAALGAPVRLAGHVDDSVLEAYLRSADVVVATAGANEGFGLVVAEALASGTPVVAAVEGGHADLVGDGDNGWCFDGTPDGLAASIVAAAQGLARSGRGAWSDRARRSVGTLRWDRHVAELESLLRNVVRRGGPDAAIVPLARAAERRAAASGR